MSKFSMTIQNILEKEGIIFDFDYPIFKEEFRTEFQEMFLDYFMFDEIEGGTLGHFKHILKSKLNLVMPYWNKIYSTDELEQRILDNYDIKEIYDKNSSNGSTGGGTFKNKVISSGTNSNHVVGEGTNNNHIIGEGTNNNKNLYKDAPKTKVDIDKMDIVNSITKDEGTNTSDSTNTGASTSDNTTTGTLSSNDDSDAASTSTNNGTGEEHWERSMTGNMGVQTDAMAIVAYWTSLRKLTLEIFETELSELFMGVY